MDKKTQQTVLVVLFIALLLGSYLVRTMRERENDQPPPAAPGDTRPDNPGTPAPDSQADPSVHLTMGNPSGATTDETNRNNYLMRKPYFAVSYNDGRGSPNWVSWRLQKADLGSAPRAEFAPDTTLPHGFHRITPHDYTGSGFDRGHMCPHSDRSGSPETSTATFVMSNIIPQAPAVNQKAWADLEDYCRGLVARRHQTLYIISGPQGTGGTGTKGPAETIAGGRVTVPAKCWKVVLAVDDGTGTPLDVTRVGRDTRTIAVVMPNDESVGHGWAKYRTSVKEIEALTGYTFFDRVPARVIDPLKAKVDDEHIPAARHAPSRD